MTAVPARPRLRRPHRRTVDHLPSAHWYDRVNKKVAIAITRSVGTMWCAYLFTAIALTSLPSVLALHSIMADVSWLAQTFLQLVLLSVIIVGQNIQAEASDVRSEKTFEDTELLLALCERTLAAVGVSAEEIRSLLPPPPGT